MSDSSRQQHIGRLVLWLVVTFLPLLLVLAFLLSLIFDTLT